MINDGQPGFRKRSSRLANWPEFSRGLSARVHTRGGEHFLRDSQNIYQTSREINVSHAANGLNSGDKRKKIFLHQLKTGYGTEKGVRLRQIITGIKKKAE